jgi:hypothetical protein
MANPNPNTDGLALGRGKRDKLGHEQVSMRMSPQTRKALEEIAEQYGCFYGGKPWLAGLLTKIGFGELKVMPAPDTYNPKRAVKERLRRKSRRAS